MTVTVSGKLGEGKTCIANIIRQAMGEYGIAIDMGQIKFMESDVAADMLAKRIVVKIVEVEEV